jgi:SAM-dependent methyltransferase
MPGSVTRKTANGAFLEEGIPYRCFAIVYDALFGNQMFSLFIRNFEHLINRYNIFFRTIADVACGSGSFVRYLNRWNVPVWGVDISPSMIRIARQKNVGGRTRFLIQDMRKLQLPFPVDLITCNFDSLNYLLTVPDLRKAFQKFNRNLIKGGYLIFDMIIDTGRNRVVKPQILKFKLPGIVSVWRISRLPEKRLRQVVMNNCVEMKNGIYRFEKEIHRQRAYPIVTIRDLLNRSGFRILGMHNAYWPLPADRHDTRVVFVAQKR